MIISHKYKFIFFAIPKTGTHSIRQALREVLDEGDEEQVYHMQKSTLSCPELANIQHGHITCVEAKKYLDKNLWNTYYKFAFFRNPFDRFISASFFLYKNNSMLKKYPYLELKRQLLFPEETTRLWYQKQSDFVLDIQGNLLIDFLGHTESMQKDYNCLASKLGFPSRKLNSTNQSSHQPYYTYYNQDLESAIYSRYQIDFKLAAYNKEVPING